VADVLKYCVEGPAESLWRRLH